MQEKEVHMLRAEAEFKIAKELMKVSKIFREYMDSNGYGESDLHCLCYKRGDILLFSFDADNTELHGDDRYVLNYSSSHIKNRTDRNIVDFIRKMAESEE